MKYLYYTCRKHFLEHYQKENGDFFYIQGLKYGIVSSKIKIIIITLIPNGTDRDFLSDWYRYHSSHSDPKKILAKLVREEKTVNNLNCCLH